MNEKNTDLSKWESYCLEDEENAWYTKYHFISHAGGGIDGHIYTNSLEAWENSYKNGNRVFDADLNFTSDGMLVLRHSWKDHLEQGALISADGKMKIDRNGECRVVDYTAKQMSFEEFKNTKIFYKYTPLTVNDMLKFMDSHKDLYISIDYKGEAEDVYTELLDIVNELHLESTLDRMIVNVYSEEAYESIMGVYQFKHVTARQYAGNSHNYYELLDFCLRKNIHVLNVSLCYIDDEILELFESKGIHIYVAIVNQISDMKYYHDTYGIDGAVSDWLYQSDWSFVE